MDEVMMWLPLPLYAPATPLIAALLDSVPPLVKTTSSSWQPSIRASWPRASSTPSRAIRPNPWPLEGLPK